jgi:outer membrane protein TolC
MRLSASVLLVLALSAPSLAQQATSVPDAVTLGTLQRAAIAADPRSGQLALLEAQSALRQRNVLATRLPGISLDGQTQYQSDVPESPFTLPSGQPIFMAPHGSVDASARVEQRLFDPLRQPQLSLERAQLAEQQARVRTSLFSLRQQIREAFFAAYGIRERMAVLGISITVLVRNRDDADARLRAGTAVPADVAEVDAALLDLRQENESLSSQLQGVLQRIQMLTGLTLSLSTPLVVPDPETVINRSLGAASTARPEFAQFAETRSRLSHQLELVDAQQRPRLSAFGRVGYGRPGLNFIGDRFDLYGIVGMQLQWHPDTWGTAAREREAIRLQQQIVQADEEAFRNGIEAQMPTYVYPLMRLGEAIADDDRIIALREQVEQTASVRLQAGAITMAEYLARNAELMQARSARAARRVELAQKAAEMMDVAGVEIP